MFNVHPNANEEDLFDLAATLAGCEPVDLIKVRRDPAGLVVILITGQKFVFDPSALGAEVEYAVRAQLANVLGGDIWPAPEAPAKPAAVADRPPKKKKAA